MPVCIFGIKMPQNTCVKCKHEIFNELFECELCSGKFHALCATPRTVDVHGQQIQGCFRCAKDEEKRKLTLLDSTVATKSSNANENCQSSVSNYFLRPSGLVSETHVDMSEVNSPIRKQNSDSGNFSSLVRSLVEKVNCLPNLVEKVGSIDKRLEKVDELKNDLLGINNKLTTFIDQCNSSVREILLLKNRVSQLETSVANVATTSTGPEIKREIEYSFYRTFEIVIMGLSANLLIDKFKTLSELAKFLGIDFAVWHIAQTRVFKSRDDKNEILFVRFISPSFRTAWLSAKKAKGLVKCSDIFEGHSNNFIYINERQTQRERRELIEAQNLCKSLGFAGCWMTDGKILYKKTPTSRVLNYNLNPPINENVNENSEMDISQENVMLRNNIASNIQNADNIPNSGVTHLVTTGVKRDARSTSDQNISLA